MLAFDMKLCRLKEELPHPNQSPGSGQKQRRTSDVRVYS
jgi:hypothetical protein